MATRAQQAAQEAAMKQIKDPSTVQTISMLTAELARVTEAQRKKTPTEVARDQIMAALDALGGRVVGEDTILYKGTQIVLPETMEGNLTAVIELLEQLRDAEEEEYEFSRTFPYRPWDGAAAFNRAMERVFGSLGVGKAKITFFGRRPPQYITIPTAHDQDIQVPWGEVKFALLDDAVFELGVEYDDEKGALFNLSVEAKRKHRKRIEGFFDVVADELEQRSIYRGKAIDAQENPGFLNPWLTDPAKVVYAQTVRTQLAANVWTVIENAATMRELDMPLKRAVLLEGPYGSGKSLAGALTAQKAVANGWTFILVRSGDDPYAALRTARLYAPAVVLIEDLDVLSAGKTRVQVTGLLDALDGVQAKGAEVMALFTTNFARSIDRGVLRPGRIDAVIRIAELDEGGYEELVKATLPAHLLGDIDYPKVSAAFRGFLPAFATEAIQRAMRYLLARTGGTPGKITTEDLVEAAAGLRPQLELVEAAGEAAFTRPTMEKQMQAVVLQVLENVTLQSGPNGHRFRADKALVNGQAE